MKDYSIKTHIDYREIKAISILKGFLINNWVLTLLIGVVLLIASLIWGSSILLNWDIELGDTRLSYRIFLMYLTTPWLLFIGGILVIIISLKRNKKLIINTHNKQIRVSIKELEKEGRIEELINFLKERVELKIENKA